MDFEHSESQENIHLEATQLKNVIRLPNLRPGLSNWWPRGLNCSPQAPACLQQQPKSVGSTTLHWLPFPASNPGGRAVQGTARGAEGNSAAMHGVGGGEGGRNRVAQLVQWWGGTTKAWIATEGICAHTSTHCSARGRERRAAFTCLCSTMGGGTPSAAVEYGVSL